MSQTNKNQNKIACVVIPVYKQFQELSAGELLSLATCRNVLAGHSLYIACSSDMDVSPYREYFCERDVTIQFEIFSPFYFSSIIGYNSLMLSPAFYKRFSCYNYMLVYQLDAIVFEDRLIEWCQKGYDYIGAPWLIFRYDYTEKKKICNWLKMRRWNLRYHCNKKDKNGIPYNSQTYNRVGNGGLSLRRIAKFIEVLELRKADVDYYRMNLGTRFFNEDIFFALELNRKVKTLDIPDYKEAASFSIELEPRAAMLLTNGKLPFGCHAWEKERDFWMPYINQYFTQEISFANCAIG